MRARPLRERGTVREASPTPDRVVCARADHDDLKRLLDDIRPFARKEEQQRRAGMSQVELVRLARACTVEGRQRRLTLLAAEG